MEISKFIHCSKVDDSVSLLFSDQAIISGTTQLKEDASKAVTASIERVYSTTLVVNWYPKLDSDLTILPHLPPEVKVLHIRNCPNIFCDPTSVRGGFKLAWWFKRFYPRLVGLNKLVLTNCGYVQQDLGDLQRVLPQIKIEVNK